MKTIQSAFLLLLLSLVSCQQEKSDNKKAEESPDVEEATVITQEGDNGDSIRKILYFNDYLTQGIGESRFSKNLVFQYCQQSSYYFEAYNDSKGNLREIQIDDESKGVSKILTFYNGKIQKETNLQLVISDEGKEYVVSDWRSYNSETGELITDESFMHRVKRDNDRIVIELLGSPVKNIQLFDIRVHFGLSSEFRKEATNLKQRKDIKSKTIAIGLPLDEKVEFLIVEWVYRNESEENGLVFNSFVRMD